VSARAARRIAVAWVTANETRAVRVGEAAAIVDPAGAPAGWLVPVTAGEDLVGFVQVSPAGAFMRYAGFPHPVDAQHWLDPAHVLRVARSKAPRGARLSAPVLTYDRVPSRVVWAVRARHAGNDLTIFVAGDYAYTG
jgi:hypothetical protein